MLFSLLLASAQPVFDQRRCPVVAMDAINIAEARRAGATEGQVLNVVLEHAANNNQNDRQAALEAYRAGSALVRYVYETNANGIISPQGLGRLVYASCFSSGTLPQP